MGLILSVWKRLGKKATTKEILEEIEENINELKSTLHRNEELRKRTALTLVLFSISIYLVAAVVFYLWFLPENWSDRLVWTFPFLCFPFVVMLLKRFLHFVFVTRIEKHAKRLEALTKKKEKILEDVMDTETYKVAKELLTLYDPHGKLTQKDSGMKPPSPVKSVLPQGQELRQRTNVVKSEPMQNPIKMPLPVQAPIQTTKRPPLVHQSRSVSLPPARIPTPMGNGQSPLYGSQSNLAESMSASTPNLNCPILPRDRTFFDKVAEYFIGDGPSYRFALICKQCFSHNGMALEDEFEYMAFRCCYCGMFNQSRKERLTAPALDELKDDDSASSSTATGGSVIEASSDLKRQDSTGDPTSKEDEDTGSEDVDTGDEKEKKYNTE